jgi:DNA-3-methyladenine glycosylase I
MNGAHCRCQWPGSDSLMIEYHDHEWGVPVHDDRKIFEFFVLDAFQAGLSWKTVLHKRENFRKAFADFFPEQVAQFNDEDIQRLLQDAGIIRNRMKIEATIHNARLVEQMHRRGESFAELLWDVIGGKTIQNQFSEQNQLPARSAESDLMSKELKKLGFKFVGTTICYAFMQAAGMVNDHLTTCYRYQELSEKAR